jgi:predicted aspartyl protease
VSPSSLTTSRDEADRITVPVRINDKGPFAFVIDTGADRTVISKELAAELDLPRGPPAMLSASSGAELTQTSVIDSLEVGRRTLRHIDAPALFRANLGAAGMLGLDSLRGQSVVFDFRRRRILVQASRPVLEEPDVVVVYAKSLYGQLILVDAHVGRVPIYVILDSGAQNTVANTRLGEMLGLHSPYVAPHTPVEVISVTGGQTPGEFMVLPAVTLGSVTLHNLPVAFADLHTFARFNLTHRPAMLLGIDVLRVFDSVSVDFGRKAVSFVMP